MKQPHLNRKLVLEAPSLVPDGAGGFTQGWQPSGTLWASVEGRAGRETRVGDAGVSRMSYRIIVRAAPVGSAQRPSPDQRFREGARVFVIRAVAERDPAGRYLTCFADEEVAA
ncbi:MAG: head-tail adaptor protein [Rhodobacteraceae bacterium]|nr:head-tail adaptor protein [Paracoccaceae bacterium]